MISVVIPTYNRAKYLKIALTSLVNQSLSTDNFEVVVVDDGSSDGTKKITEGFLKKINVKYVYQDYGGVSKARNKGIDKSLGTIIVFFDDDAVATNNWLISIVEIMKNEDIITGKVEPIKNNIWQYFAPHYDQGDKSVESNVLLEGNCAIKKEVFDDMGYFDEGLTYGHEGREFISRVKRKYKIMYYPNVIIKHDYAFGIFNYLNKQFKFGHKMVYLKRDQISSLLYLIFNYKKIKQDKIASFKSNKKVNFWKKIKIYHFAKLGGLAHFLGSMVGYISYKQ